MNSGEKHKKNICSREEKRGLNAEREALENEFSESHFHCSDEELLDLVRQKTAELGHPPKKDEMVGFILLKTRFGPWPRVLEKAGVKPPKAKKK